jgi:hypothetical protein
MRIVQFFFLLFFPATAMAQTSFQFRLETSIPVSQNGIPLSSAWSGGLNSAEYNTMDLDSDEKDDLVLYDRTAQKVITYLQKDGAYEYAPHYETFFPADIYNWMLLRDFNCDGRKDLFTGHIFGISVYQNVSDGDEIKWEHFPFFDGNSTSEVILTKGLSGRINLQIQFDDLPAIDDADGDGDVDVFVMNYGGSGTIQFHKNFSMERYGICDSLDFELADPWWGGVRECECDAFAFNNEECATGGRTEHAGGKSLMLMDGDADGFQDLLISEGECGILNMLDNNGPADAPQVESAPAFPLGISQEFNLYPTGYFEDLDFDGVKDFVISTNIFSKSSYDVNLRESNWYYKNTGSNDNPTFQLQTKSFLQNTMIDAGDNVVPAFADADGDGDFDMFLSNNDFPATVSLYRNTGSAFEPSFESQNPDFADLSTEGFILMKIQTADINADGRIDLVLTATKAEENFTDIFYLLNKNSQGMDFSGQSVTRLNFQVSRGDNVSFIHIDNDGRIDILKGRTNGAVEYWRHAEGINFVLENPQFMGMEANVFSTRRSFAAADLDADGNIDLVIGDETGRIKIIPSFRGADHITDALQDVVFNELSQGYYAPNLGGRVWPATVDLYGTGKPVIALGSVLGGVRILRNVNDETPFPVINVYPNPVAPALEKLIISTNRNASLQIFSASGQQVRPAIDVPEKEIVQLALHDYAAGVYILRFSVDNKTYIRRLVVY